MKHPGIDRLTVLAAEVLEEITTGVSLVVSALGKGMSIRMARAVLGGK